MEFIPYQNEEEAYVALWNATNPRYPITLERLRYIESIQSPDAKSVHFWVVSKGERIASYRLDTPINSPLEGELALRFVVPEPEHAKAIFDHALHSAKSLGATRLQIQCDEDLWGYGFFLEQSCTEVERMWESILQLENLNPNGLLPKVANAKQVGLEIISLQSQLENPDFIERYYRGVIEILADVPSTTPFVPWDFETWKKRALYHPTFLPEAEFIGMIGGEIAGVSQLFGSSKAGELQTGLTGVRRDFRRLGVAVALKLAAADYAKTHGYTSIKTMNHVVNRPMLSINEAMGFVKQPATVKLQKLLEV
jgi:GNAT superfamily N-acetyltransferase